MTVCSRPPKYCKPLPWIKLTVSGSSADINPIGSISKVDLGRFITWSVTNLDMPVLTDFIHAIPTAELEPITSDYVSSWFSATCICQMSILTLLRRFNRTKPTWALPTKNCLDLVSFEKPTNSALMAVSSDYRANGTRRALHRARLRTRWAMRLLDY